MKHVVPSLAALGTLLFCGSAYAECGDVTIAGFSWQSAESLAYVDEFILKNGYGCNASVITGDTVPTITSMAEKGQPDIAPETTPKEHSDMANQTRKPPIVHSEFGIDMYEHVYVAVRAEVAAGQ